MRADNDFDIVLRAEHEDTFYKAANIIRAGNCPRCTIPYTRTPDGWGECHRCDSRWRIRDGATVNLNGEPGPLMDEEWGRHGPLPGWWLPQ